MSQAPMTLWNRIRQRRPTTITNIQRTIRRRNRSVTNLPPQRHQNIHQAHPPATHHHHSIIQNQTPGRWAPPIPIPGNHGVTNSRRPLLSTEMRQEDSSTPWSNTMNTWNNQSASERMELSSSPTQRIHR